MTVQQHAAMRALSEWLANVHVLGRRPSKIEGVGEFELHGLHYYIFKFKKNLLGKWLLGVCGGYESLTATEHCGHIFSELKPYDPMTAVQEAIAMVGMIREYWEKQAAATETSQQQQDKDNAEGKEGGIFSGFVLLDSDTFDPEQLKTLLQQDWNITYAPAADDVSSSGDDVENPATHGSSTSSSSSTSSTSDAEKDGTLVFEHDSYMLAVSFVNAPVPNGEAELCAQGNYLWKEAVEAVKSHTAQIILAVFTRDGSPIDSGRLYAKLASSCLKLPNAVGLYSSGTVFQPAFFIKMAETMKTDGLFPLLNLVHIGLAYTEQGINGYTCGLKAFGKDEIEITESSVSPAELRDFLIDIAGYIIEEDITLRSGETIGFTAEQKLPITRSKGVYVSGYSLKIKL